ncbi:uncharacterized protein NPIL_510541 [Nephila pilipes]|uniref:Transposase n=1 Tax=Nephila pilipes TaxID=299642 RepID=A0A8X6N2D4_NEPPI|nr:uncharacterized protein NPIL_510541 [Nephila pilipes]
MITESTLVQDGAPAHIHRRVQQVIRQNFSDLRVIGRCLLTAWPPLSPDLSLWLSRLWGFLRDHFYGERTATLTRPKHSIIRHVRGINADL